MSSGQVMDAATSSFNLGTVLLASIVLFPLAYLFFGTRGMLNILGLTRFLQLGSIGGWPIVVAVGALPYPITFLCTDLISELWGEQKANQVVWVGLLLNGWVLLILWLGAFCRA